MKKSRFTEAQIVSMLQQHDSGNEGHRHMSRQRYYYGDFLQLEAEVRRYGCPTTQRAKIVTGREQEAQSHVR